MNFSPPPRALRPRAMRLGFVWASATSLAAFSLLTLASCARTDLGPPEATLRNAGREAARGARDAVQNAGASATLSGGTLEGGDEQGRPLWRISAKTIHVRGQETTEGTPNHATLTDAHATLYRAGKVEVNFESKQLELFKNAGGMRLLMTGKVKARSEGLATGERGPVQIEAPRADVDVTKRLVVASGGVLVTHQKVKVRAQTMRGRTALEVVDLTGNVVGQSAEGGEVRAKTAHYDWKGDRLSAQTVTATRDDVTLSGTTLLANTSAQRGTLSGPVTAKSPRGVANSPSLAFDWGHDLITAPRATLQAPDGTMHAAALRTDSKLRVASARDLVVQKDGATLKARSADGFDGLKKLSGESVTVTRPDGTITASHAQSNDWSGQSGIIVATGGVTVHNTRGDARAQRATWTGGENGRLDATGGVEIRAQGNVLRGDRAQSDAKFQNATMTGHVDARLASGGTLRAPILVKTGDRIVASHGAVGTFKSGGELGVLTLRAARLESTTQANTARASGGVTITSQTGVTVTSKEALYSKPAQTITSQGEVVLHDPRRGLTQRGDSLVADLGLKRVTLKNVRGQGSTQLFSGKHLFD